MKLVVEQLLLDKEAEAAKAAEADYANLIEEIGDRVFTGYELQKVELGIAPKTEVKLYLRPWNAVVKDVQVDLQFSGMAPGAVAMLQSKLPNIESELTAIIQGASVDAVDWAGGVLRKKLRQKLQESLPEFKAAVDLIQEDAAEKTVVQVVLYPVGDTVRAVNYEMRSESVPNIVLMKLKYKYLDRCNELRGLPVEYVKKHRKTLEELWVQELQKEATVRGLRLQPSIKLVPGTNTNVEINLYSERYKIWAEGYADIGRKDDNLSGKLHVGKYISSKDEIFGEVELVTDDVHWSFGAGYARKWGNSTWSYRRRMPEADNVYKFEYDFGNKWRVRAEHFTGDNRNEFALRYRIHEFLGAEYVYGGKKSYLRIVGNL